MKKLGLGPEKILSFLVAIAGSVVICGVITYSRTKNVLNSNMQLTSEQTLESALNSLQTYEKTISLPVDLLTRKTSIKRWSTRISLMTILPTCRMNWWRRAR